MDRRRIMDNGRAMQNKWDQRGTGGQKETVKLEINCKGKNVGNRRDCRLYV
jgi:hypothetical protein